MSDLGRVCGPVIGATQQVVDEPATAAIFLVVTVHDGAEDVIRDLLADTSALVRSVGFRSPEGDLSCVVGVGSRFWDRIFGTPKPAHLHPFIPLAGSVHTAVSTPGDLLFHLRARRMDLCFELAGQLMNRLRGSVEVVDEVHGFRFFDERDLLGFVDGTENPNGQTAVDAVTIGDDDPGFAGGSYVIVQKYLHDLGAWNALTVEQQEAAIGRHKLTNIEIPDEDKAPNSHLALNVIEDADGNQLQIVRDNMPFGRPGSAEFGTYFIGYAKDPAVTEQMLENMFIGKPAGTYDRVLDFSTAVTGCLFFVPSPDFLDDPPAFAAPRGTVEKLGTATDPSSAAETDDAPDGSLSIGSLRGTR